MRTADPRILLEPGMLGADVLASMHEGVLLRDAHGTVRYANPAAARVLGLAHREFDNDTALDLSRRLYDEHGRAWTSRST